MLETSGIKTTFGKVSVDNIEPHAFKDQFDRAQVRQVVTKQYPSARPNSSLAGEFFSGDAFGLDTTEYNSNRVSWYTVPKGTTVDQFSKLLGKAHLQAYRSNDINDVLSDEQKWSLNNTDQTLENYQDRFRVKRADEKGNIVELEGPPQYVQYFLQTTFVEDIDKRVTTTTPATALSAMDAGAGVP